MSNAGKSTFIAACAIAVFLGSSWGVAAQSPTTYTVQVYVYGTYCVGDTLRLEGYVYPSSVEHQFKWSIAAPSGGTAVAYEQTTSQYIAESGTYRASFAVLDKSGRIVGENSTSMTVFHCGTPTMTTQAHQDCYDPSYGFYDCNYPPQNSTRCAKYYDNRTGEWMESCPTAGPTPSATSYPYDSSACAALTDEQSEFYRQWKYDYYQYYDQAGQEPGSDPDFETKMRQEAERFDISWQERWNGNGCDRPYTNPDCTPRWQEAERPLADLKARWAITWDSFYQELEDARARWSSYSDDERREIEEKWRERAAQLSAQYDADMQALVDQYRLWECGYTSQSAPIEPEFRVAESAPPMTSMASLQSDCDARMIAAKDLYTHEFQSLRDKLETTSPTTAEYESVRTRLSELEQKVAAELEAILVDCRNDYREEYHEPRTFGDGVGSLRCYYEDLSGKIHCKGVYVSFTGDPQSQFLSRFSCGGQPVFDDIFANRVFEGFEFLEDQDSDSLLIHSDQLKLLFHDAPRGVINVGVVGDAEVYFVPSPHLRISAAGDRIHMEGPDGWAADFMGSAAGAISWDELKGVLTVTGEATWFAQSCRPDGADPDGDLGAEYYEAIRARRLGAQVTIRLDGETQDVHEEDYADMDIAVEHQGGRRFLATIDSLEGTCKTIILKFDAGVYDTIKLKVGITDEMGRPIESKEANDLQDVLDPCNDGEQGFEYWVVQDRLGTQLLLSFAHFSEKRVSVEAASVGNVVVPGFDMGAGLLAVGLAAVGSVALRRKLTR